VTQLNLVAGEWLAGNNEVENRNPSDLTDLVGIYAQATSDQFENADSVRDGVEIDVRREPVGVVAVISPWNFPTATASWKIAPALCYGNAVVWKPANITPASAVELTKIIDKQDIPKGLFSL